MPALTTQYLDKKLKNLATKDDIKGARKDVEALRLTTKEGIKRLDTKIENEIAGLARMTANGFEEIKNELDIKGVKRDVRNLNQRTSRIEQALNIKN